MTEKVARETNKNIAISQSHTRNWLLLLILFWQRRFIRLTQARTTSTMTTRFFFKFNSDITCSNYYDRMLAFKPDALRLIAERFTLST